MEAPSPIPRQPTVEELQNMNRAHRRMWSKKLGFKIRGTQDSHKPVTRIANPLQAREEKFAFKKELKKIIAEKKAKGLM